LEINVSKPLDSPPDATLMGGALDGRTIQRPAAGWCNYRNASGVPLAAEEAWRADCYSSENDGGYWSRIEAAGLYQCHRVRRARNDKAEALMVYVHASVARRWWEMGEERRRDLAFSVPARREFVSGGG
jgi:hypothetical protein